MAGFSFADSYRAAGLAPTPEIIRLRQEPFNKMRKELDAATAVDLTRLYFGLAVPGGTDWFRDGFGETDPSFSLYDNAREAAVLAAGLLEAALADGKVYAGLAPITTAAAGLREPLVRPELIGEAETAISEKAIADRRRPPVEPGRIKLPSESKVPAEAAALVQAGDWQKASALFTLVGQEANDLTKALATQVFNVVKPLAAQVVDLREEASMLWWHIGGWSRLLERPFSELHPGLAAVMAGLDLADLSETSTGPVAVPAILQRTIAAGRKAKSGKVNLKDALSALPHDALDGSDLGGALDGMAEICPILTALDKAWEIGPGDAWHKAFAKATGLAADSPFLPLDLAMQTYRERLLLSALD